jgi:hypothetical protein
LRLTVVERFQARFGGAQPAFECLHARGRIDQRLGEFLAVVFQFVDLGLDAGLGGFARLKVVAKDFELALALDLFQIVCALRRGLLSVDFSGQCECRAGYQRRGRVQRARRRSTSRARFVEFGEIRRDDRGVPTES